MLYVFNVVFPVFALILLGYVAGKSGKLGMNASTELNRFVIWLALPAQLFHFASASSFESLWQPGFILAFGLSALSIFMLTMFFAWYRKASLAAASFAGLSACYSNTGYMGIPLCVLALGQAGFAPAVIATFIVFFLLALATIFIEISNAEHKQAHEIIWSVIRSLFGNPLLVAPIAGLLWSASGWVLYNPLEQCIVFLAAAASPCALVSIGLFLMQKGKVTTHGAWSISLTKLIAQPLLAWIIAVPILD